MNNPSRSCYYFFSAIESGEQINVKTKEGHEIYSDAEEALQKQIPKKPILKDTFTTLCPNCGEEINTSHVVEEYCHKCGQAIDLNDEGNEPKENFYINSDGSGYGRLINGGTLTFTSEDLSAETN